MKEGYEYCDCGNELMTDSEQRNKICNECI